MPNSKLKKSQVPVPETMKSLPVAEKGYHKPWFVKNDDFRVVDSDKAQLSYHKQACWICGQPFQSNHYALVGSPLSAMFRNFREPPCHEECAAYAMQVCPFLLYPNATRRSAGLEGEELVEVSNQFLDVKLDPENQGEHYIVLVDDFDFDAEKLLIKCSEAQIIERQFWKEGIRQAEIPDPIVDFKDLPDDIRQELITTGQISPVREISLKNSHISASLVPVTPEAHRNKYWRHPENYHFAAKETLVKLGANEVTSAVHTFPLGFVKEENQYHLVAILGVQPSTNFYVDSDGSWRATYLPVAFRTYPFTLGEYENLRNVLCVDGNLGSLLDSEEDGEDKTWPFFQNDGQVSQKLLEVKKTLSAIGAAFNQSIRIANELSKHGLIQPWPIRIQGKNGGTQIQLSGLYCVDESGLNALPADELALLRGSGALLLAYCQLLSMKHLSSLGENEIPMLLT